MSPRHLVLFDIDGTLLSGGPAKEAFHGALLEVFGTAGPIESWEFSGKTDPQIARELLIEAGLSDERIDEGFPTLWDRYLERLEAGLPERPTLALPGAATLLSELSARGGAALALLTGNLAGGARLKLGSAGLASWFPVGAFGSDHEVRNRLPEIALRRAREHWGVSFGAREVVIVGDTPRDVACGQHHGARTLAVATGRFGPEVLEEAGADVVFPDLTQTELVIEAILSP